MKRAAVLFSFFLALSACCRAADDSLPDAGMGGAGGSAPTCAEWVTETPVRRCPEHDADGCTTLGDGVVAWCCPPDAPCKQPADSCQPTLGISLAWCCLPACPDSPAMPLDGGGVGM